MACSSNYWWSGLPRSFQVGWVDIEVMAVSRTPLGGAVSAGRGSKPGSQILSKLISKLCHGDAQNAFYNGMAHCITYIVYNHIQFYNTRLYVEYTLLYYTIYIYIYTILYIYIYCIFGLKYIYIYTILWMQPAWTIQNPILHQPPNLAPCLARGPSASRLPVAAQQRGAGPARRRCGDGTRNWFNLQKDLENWWKMVENRAMDPDDHVPKGIPHGCS